MACKALRCGRVWASLLARWGLSGQRRIDPLTLELRELATRTSLADAAHADA